MMEKGQAVPDLFCLFFFEWNSSKNTRKILLRFFGTFY